MPGGKDFWDKEASRLESLQEQAHQAQLLENASQSAPTANPSFAFDSSSNVASRLNRANQEIVELKIAVRNKDSEIKRLHEQVAALQRERESRRISELEGRTLRYSSSLDSQSTPECAEYVLAQ